MIDRLGTGWALLVAGFVLVFGLAFSPTAAAVNFNSYGEAASACATAIANSQPPTTGSYVCQNTILGPAGAPTYCSVDMVWTVNGQHYLIHGYPCDQQPGPPNGCAAGQTVPSGSNYKFFPYPDAVGAADGIMCTGGSTGSSCEMQMGIGIAGAAGDPSANGYMLTGGSCPVHTGPDPVAKPVPVVAQATNADGGKTYCDSISGKCVTVSPGPQQAPASSSSSPNNTTNSTGTSSTPASSSSSTTTTTSSTTVTGSGSGSGSGNSTGTGTSTSSTHQTNPASASTTSDKCTTGACDVGNADGNIGQMYVAGTDSPSSVYSQFKADVSSSPIIGAASGFFSVSGLSGTCPTWQIPGNKYWGASGFTFDFFCSAGMLAILALAGWMVLAAGAFCAFRIALY